MLVKLSFILILIVSVAFIVDYLFEWKLEAEPSTKSCTDRLLIKNATAVSDDGNKPSNAIDGNLSTRWSTKGIGSWIRFDLGTSKTICSLDIASYNGNLRHYNFEISVSNITTGFTKVASYTSSGSTLDPENYNIPATNARYVQLIIKGNAQTIDNALKNYSTISEVRVYGKNATGNIDESQNNIESIPSISLFTDDSSYSQGEKVTILGKVHNGLDYSAETVALRVTKTDNVTGWVLQWQYSPIYQKPAVDISLRSDTNGIYSYNFSLQDDGRYQVDAFAAPSGKKVGATTMFEVKNVLFSNSSKMISYAVFFFLMLIVVIFIGNLMYGSITTPTAFRLKQRGIANVELFRFISLTGIAFFLILAFVFADSEIGVNSPVGLVKQNFKTLNQTNMQNSIITENAWVINIGGSQTDNYMGGIQIPTFVVIFGLAGGYLRYLYGMRFFFSRWKKGDEFEDTDKNWGDLNISDNLSFLRHSLRSLSLFFLSPMLAIVIWFILFQSGTTGKWAIAAVSFSLGLITEEVIQVIIAFVRKVLVGIKEESAGKKEETKIKVMMTVPADGSSGVSVFTDILASFEVPVEQESIKNGFKLVVEKGKGSEPVLGTVVIRDNLTWSFVPKETLEPDKTYVASVENVVDLANRPCESKTWLFSTRDKPRVLDVKKGEVDKAYVIIAEFSEPVNEQSVKDNFKIKEKGSGAKVDGAINIDGKTATFRPTNQFIKGTEYIAELTTEIKDMAGNNLAENKQVKIKF